MEKLEFLETLSLEEAKAELGHFTVAKTSNGRKAMKNDNGQFIGAVADELTKGQKSCVSRVKAPDTVSPEGETLKGEEFWLLHKIPESETLWDPFA